MYLTSANKPTTTLDAPTHTPASHWFRFSILPGWLSIAHISRDEEEAEVYIGGADMPLQMSMLHGGRSLERTR